MDSYPSVGFGASSGGDGGVAGHLPQVTDTTERRNSASIASLRLLAKEHQLQTRFDVKHDTTTTTLTDEVLAMMTDSAAGVRRN